MTMIGRREQQLLTGSLIAEATRANCYEWLREEAKIGVTMTSRTLLYRPLSIGLIAALATCSAFAQDRADSTAPMDVVERDRTRSPLLYIDKPVAIEAGLDPVMPLFETQPDPELDPEFGNRLNSIQQYNSVILDIELDGGTWDGSLVEELAAIGSLQQQQGDHLAAIETFDRAIHVNRINSGLHTLEQIPVVEQLIQSYMVLGDWEQADTYNRYLFYVQQKAFGNDDPRLIPVLDRMATWNIQAFNIGYGDLLGLRLREAQIMFNAAARMVGVHFGKGDERFVSYLRNIANSAYLVSRNPDLITEIERPEYRNAQQMLAEKLNEQRQIDPPGFRTGERVLIEIAEFRREKSDDVYALAEAIADLADWYLIFGRRRGAEENYALAWQILQGQENAEELTQRLFGQVASLASFASSIETPQAFYQVGGESAGLDFDFADLLFDVTETGLVRNVKNITEETEANQAQLSKLRISIRSSRFRPMIVDGEPVRSRENLFRYRYWY